jgi:sulfonate transport system substrate-binding protein
LLLALLLCLACGKSAGNSDRAAAPSAHTVRIGYQKSGALAFLRWKGTLEPELKRGQTSVEWAEFPSGPALLEALNGAQLDFGLVGEAPPIFAQAASTNLVYVANEPSQPLAEAILVRRDSSFHAVAELRGRRIALNKGSNVHYFLVKALQQAGLQYSQVNVVFLAPADARAAFENGTVDAWAIWDPFLAAAEVGADARVLRTAEGIAPNHLFYVSRRDFVAEHAPVIRLLQEQLALTDTWILQHREEAAVFLAGQLNIDEQAMRKATERARFGVLPISDEIMANQQRIADTFLELGLLEKPLQVRDALAGVTAP